MPHVSLVSLSGFRVREERLAELGVRLPGLSARASAIGRLPPLGLLTLAGMLPDDWTCTLHEVQQVDDFLVHALVTERPDFVAISALTASAIEAYQLGDRLLEENIRTVFGGLHATACVEESTAHFDSICAGEGELIWPRLVQDIQNSQLKQLYSAVRTTVDVPWVLPKFELLAGRPLARWTLQTQRGCPLACEFCAASRTISRFREKPVEHIRNELFTIRQLDPKPVVELADDNTFAGPRDPEPLLSTLADANIRYFTEVDWRIGERAELVRQLAASGCVQVLVGIESLIFRYPGMGSKTASLERVMTAVDRIQDAGIAVIGCFIVGADGETNASLDRLRNFILNSSLADVQITLQTPFPGTPLRANLHRAGRLLPDRDWSYHTLFDVTYQPDVMSVAELERGYRELLRAVFSEEPSRRRSAIRREVWRNNPSLRSSLWNPALQ